MVTKNELVAIIAALTNDLDTPPSSEAETQESLGEARNDAYAESGEPASYIEHRKRAV